MPRTSLQRKLPLGGIPEYAVPPKVFVKANRIRLCVCVHVCCRRRRSALGSAVQWGSCQERLRETEASLKAAEASITVAMSPSCTIIYTMAPGSLQKATASPRRKGGLLQKPSYGLPRLWRRL